MLNNCAISVIQSLALSNTSRQLQIILHNFYLFNVTNNYYYPHGTFAYFMSTMIYFHDIRAIQLSTLSKIVCCHSRALWRFLGFPKILNLHKRVNKSTCSVECF